MNEIGKYGVLKEKLQGICDENNLTFSIQNKKYPFYMTVKPCGGMDAQMSMLENEDTGDTGYISPEAIIVFAYKDGELTYKMSETINISDALFNKIKNLFKKLHACWMQYYFRDRTENCACYGNACTDPEPEASKDAPYTEDGAADADEFADFFDDNADSGLLSDQ
jgi:hypothetical protein